MDSCVERPEFQTNLIYSNEYANPWKGAHGLPRVNPERLASLEDSDSTIRETGITIIRRYLNVQDVD